MSVRKEWMPWADFIHQHQEKIFKRNEAIRKLRGVNNLNPMNADKFTVFQYIDHCRRKMVEDRDGEAYYGTYDEMSQKRAFPSDLALGNRDHTWNLIYWFRNE